jgi:ABC-type uncharacterized transport system substrate-binding protein
MMHVEELVDKRTTVAIENQVIRELRAYMQLDQTDSSHAAEG